MSTTTRVISGSVASWFQIGAGLLTQLALVPICLSYWNVQTFGVWVAVQGLVNMLTILDRGHVDFLGFEFLKTGTINRQQISEILWSGFRIVIYLLLAELLIVFTVSFFLPRVIIKTASLNDHSLLVQAGWALFFQWLGWTILNTAGIFYRALTAFGYYPRMQWWSVFASVSISLTIAVIVSLGGNIAVTALGACLCQISLTIIQFFDINKLLKVIGIPKTPVNLHMGFRNLRTSSILSLKYFFENFRQQGIRIVLAPLIGVTGLAAFSTMRTASNSLLQGLSTISNPVLPELMRFLNQRNEEKMQGALGTVWLLLVFFLSPAAVILQGISPYLFSIWTRGNLIYDPYLFGLLSVSVLVFALSQPAMAILVGNNLLRPQIILSAISFAVLMLGLFILIPYFGLPGAGISLILSELIIAFCLIYLARKWLVQHKMKWPATSFRIAATSVFIAFAGIMVINYWPGFKWLSIAGILILLGTNAYLYWNSMPQLMLDKTRFFLNRFRLL